LTGRGPMRLGRGLASLMGEIPTMEQPVPGRAIKLALIEAGPFQPRGHVDPAALDELTASIAQQGVLQPILVRPHATLPDRFEIIAGERRWRAARAAGLVEIPCLVRAMSDQNAMAAALVENLQRQDLNPIEEAEGFRRLIQEFGLTQEELGTALGKSRSHVANQLRLLQLPAAILAHVEARRISAGHARAILSSNDPEAAAAMIVSQGLSVRQAEELCSKPLQTSLKQAADRPQRRSDPNLAAAEAELAESLGLKVQISFNGRGGSVRLHYQSVEQLDHVLMLLGRS